MLSGNSQFLSAATVLESQLETNPLSIHASIQQLDLSIFAKNESDASFQLQVNGFTSGTGAPDQYLNTGLLSTGGVNALFSGYHSPKMDSLITTFHGASPAARQSILGQINALVRAGPAVDPAPQSARRDRDYTPAERNHRRQQHPAVYWDPGIAQV